MEQCVLYHCSVFLYRCSVFCTSVPFFHKKQQNKNGSVFCSCVFVARFRVFVPLFHFLCTTVQVFLFTTVPFNQTKQRNKKRNIVYCTTVPFFALLFLICTTVPFFHRFIIEQRNSVLYDCSVFLYHFPFFFRYVYHRHKQNSVLYHCSVFFLYHYCSVFCTTVPLLFFHKEKRNNS